METLLYFSYGSNMSTPRIVDRVPSARPISLGRLNAHKLMFHKKSIDYSGKCDAEHTNDNKDYLIGVVFEISVLEKPELDKKEGLGKGYDEKVVSVSTPDGKQLEAVTYYATSIEPGLKPYEWYKEHVIRGAREHGLPLEYIQFIEAVEAVTDPDKTRHERELSIYR